ncbi:MAG: laccase domain-containing protein, partial [Alphaproteobacteria bacterium]|nr:laccase domain-containing protein [Alphaproteobacteria bacterium]
MRRLEAAILAELPEIAHGFFGRAGGVSAGLYASLNCGPGSGDNKAAVAENRARVAATLGATRLTSLAQIHSPIVHVAGPDWDASRHPEGDGLVTAVPGLALGILTADCAPVLLADAQAGVIGAAHAGWKGALGLKEGGVLEATIAAMESLGAHRAHISAAIGPCISQQNYEVTFDFRDRFLEQGGLRMRTFFVPSGKEGHYRFDLEGYVAHR